MPAILSILLCWCVSIVLIRQIVRNHRLLTTPQLMAAFTMKVLTGMLYGYVFLHYYGGDDTWVLNRESMLEYHKLVNDPWQFMVADFNPMRFFGAGAPFKQGLYYYLSDLEFYMMAKPLALFNVVSGGNYYVNCVFFNLILFWGHYWLFSLLVREFPAKRKPLFGLIFFFPPVLFWLSGIRSDGLLFFFTSLLLLQFYRWMQGGKKSLLMYIIIALTGMVIIRYAMALMMVPALTAWYIVVRYKRKPLPVFALVYGITIVLFFSTTLVSGTANLPAVIVKRQQEYFALPGKTRFALDSLQANAGSFVQVLPQAAGNTFIRPFIWEAKGALQVATALDILFCWLLVLMCFIKGDDNRRTYFRNPLIWTLLFFSLSMYLFIGYTVPWPGAMVRYKVMGELFLYAIAFLCIEWRNIRQIKKIHIF
jgi:hypothetical protein